MRRKRFRSRRRSRRRGRARKIRYIRISRGGTRI